MNRSLSLFGKAAALVAAALAVCAPAARAAAEAWQPNEDEALILELHSGTYRIGDTLRGYQTPAGVCVDMSDLIQALDLPVRVDRKSRRATGWIFAESERFALDRDSSTVQTMNSEHRLAADAIHDSPEGWCAELSALSGWFGVTFKPDLGNMQILLETDRKLPFLAAIERRSRAARLSPSANRFDLSQLPRQDVPYTNWRSPSVDVLVSGTLQSASVGRTRELQYEAYASGEALGVSYDARLASDTTARPTNLRLRAYRNDPDGHLLGPIHATQLAGGDVETYAGALTGQSAVGRGIFVSNRPLNRPSRFSVTTLRGELPAGWDAELYRNGQLLAFQADRGDGRYEFGDVELQFGQNDFEVTLYGPQGQIRHDRSQVPVGAESIPVGKTWYWAGVVDQDRDLVDFATHITNPLTGWRWGVGVERGIDKRTVVGFEHQSLMLNGHRRNYLEATVQRAVGPMLVELSGAQQFGSGRAVKLQALGRVGRINFQAETLWIDGGYESELVQKNDRRQYGLRLDSELKFGEQSVPVGFSMRQTSGRDGTKVTEWLTRASIGIRRLSLTAELGERISTGRGATPDDDGLRLGVLANVSVGKLRLRGDAHFRLNGVKRGLESAQMVAETHVSAQSDLRGQIAYVRDNRRADFTLGWVRQFNQFALRSEATVGTRGNVGLGLALAFSFGPDPADGGYRMTSDKLANNGQAVVTVFRDENGDGRREAGEGPVEGVEIEAGFSHGRPQTNKLGRVIVDGLRPFIPVVVGVDEGTIPDPMLQPKGKGVVVVPRPGVAAEVELGLAPTGEVEGTLLGIDGQPREGAGLELVDDRGQVIARTLTEFDGYFLFDQAPYGHYRMRLAASSAAALSARPEISADMTVDRAHASLRLGIVRLAADPKQVAATP
ncbi:MAG: carboxypeptidase regulatory-like domain-containing protein [Sphingomonadales bacterium]|nr:carboxypeptidase regulatory-like domain-containing protein [Sphingomonadales bacterium]